MRQPKVTWEQLDTMCKLLKTPPPHRGPMMDDLLKVLERRMEQVETLKRLRRDGKVTVTRTTTTTFEAA